MLFFDMFIGFGDLIKTLKDKTPATTKTTQRGRAAKMELNCKTYLKDTIIIGIFSELSRIFRASYKAFIKVCQGGN